MTRAALTSILIAIALHSAQAQTTGEAKDAKQSVQPAAPSAAPKSFRARLAPGQVAIYETSSTGSENPDQIQRSRMRVDVLRHTDDGLVVRCTEGWDGKIGAPRPAPGREDRPQGASTIDILVPYDGSQPTVFDYEATRDELIATALRGGKDAGKEKMNAAAATMRRIMDEKTVNSSVFGSMGMLLDGLGAPLAVGQGAAADVNETLEDGSAVVSGRRKIDVAVNDKGAYVRTATTDTPVATRRRDLRAIGLRTAAAMGSRLDPKALEAVLNDKLAKAQDEHDVLTAELDPATGWPTSVQLTDQSYKGTTTTRKLRLVEGPTPVVPPPPADETGAAYAEWIVSLVDSDKSPLCAFGRDAAEELDGPNAAQRKVLMDGAIADGAPPRGAIPPAVILADAASRNLTQDQSTIVEVGYAKLPPEARAVVLSRIAFIKEQWGQELFARLLASTPTQKDLADVPGFEGKHDADAANAALATYLRTLKPGDFDWSTLVAAYKLDRAGTLSAANKPAAMERAATVLRRTLGAMEPKQKSEPGAWVYEEGYAPSSALAALAADVLGSAEGDTGLAELQRALRLTDARPRAFAAVALAKRGKPPEPAVFESICARPVGWEAVARGLRAAGKTDLMPASARSLEMAATADMVAWLMYPTELGREPDAVELIKTLDGEGKREKERYYIFKFRSDAEGFKERGWMLGVSGPWRTDRDFTQPGGSDTFSKLDPVGKGSPDEQAKEIIELIRENWKKAPDSDGK